MFSPNSTPTENTLKAAFTSWVVVPTDGGAALKAITAAWAGSTITPTVLADIENDAVEGAEDLQSRRLGQNELLKLEK